jgi:DNA-binding transcriptional ArsR family regulator
MARAPADCVHDHRVIELPPAPAVEATARLFRALGDPGRLSVLLCLRDGEACVSELAEALGDGLSTVSQRLRLLHADGLVSRRREGKHIYYGLADAHVADLVGTSLAHALEPREVIR